MLHAGLVVAVALMVLFGLSQSAVANTASAPVDHVGADSVNAFACDLYNRIAGERAGDNVFISPFSMSCALAMTAEGARGQTADEMARVLHAPDDLSALHQALGLLSDRLGEKPAPSELRD